MKCQWFVLSYYIINFREAYFSNAHIFVPHSISCISKIAHTKTYGLKIDGISENSLYFLLGLASRLG